jgi:threonine dehydratase
MQPPLAPAASGDGDGVGDDACPVYCYVACSPTRSDYLERVLTSRVYDIMSETPLEHAPLLSDRVGCRLLLKREDTTEVKSFKQRGAYNMMAQADPAVLRNGVVAASAGNHAQGVALAAQVLGVRATIVMPAVTPKIKVDAVLRRGAEALLHGDNFDAAKAMALKLCESDGRLFVPPFDHPDVSAGQGTVGLELIRQTPDMDVVLVPVGGGGLIAGIATVIKRLRPQVRIVGVEPVDADALHRSMLAGERVRLESVGTFADGVAVIEVGEETFRLCKDLVDEVILVDTDEICAAIKDVFEETRSILEPAGALGVAGAKAYAARNKVEGKTLVAITSGANTNFDRLRHVSERAEIGEGRESIFAVTIPERPGAFCDLITCLGRNISISEFNYRYAGEGDAHVFVGASVLNRAESTRILAGLQGAGYEALDLTDNEMAKLHIRHLVGGNAPSLAKEAVFRFEFPERPGALRRFLRGMPVGWNITMFHYRNHGADVGRVLVGLDTMADGDAVDRLGDFVSRLGYTAVREDDNPAYKFFLGRG